MNAFDALALVAGLVGITAGTVFFGLWWRLHTLLRDVRRELMRHMPPPPKRQPAPMSAVEHRSPGAPVARPHEPLPSGQTVVLPPQLPVRRRINGGR